MERRRKLNLICWIISIFPGVLKIVNALGVSMDEFAEYPERKKNKVEDSSYGIPVCQNLNAAEKVPGYEVKDDVFNKESV